MGCSIQQSDSLIFTFTAAYAAAITIVVIDIAFLIIFVILDCIELAAVLTCPATKAFFSIYECLFFSFEHKGYL